MFASTLNCLTPLECPLVPSRLPCSRGAGSRRQGRGHSQPAGVPAAVSARCVADGSTCTMSEWITWSPCSISCGTGMRSRERYVKQFPEDGSVCTLPTEETEKCTVNEECCEWGRQEGGRTGAPEAQAQFERHRTPPPQLPTAA